MKVRAFIEALEAIAREKGDDTPVWVPDQNCGCCNDGPAPVDAPEFLAATPASERHQRPACVYLTREW